VEENLTPNQQEVVNLLEKLGKSEVNYPPELMAHARAAFQYKVVAAKVALVDTSAALGEAQAAGAAAESGAGMFAWQTAVKVTLATALVTAAAYGAYLLSEFLPSLLDQSTPTAAYVVPAEVVETATEITETVEPTETPVAPATHTPEPEATTEREHPGLQLGRTPGPPAAPGQTKTPDKP
jgi:hypothetical protein